MFVYYAGNFKVSSLVSIFFFIKKFKFLVKIGFEIENLC